MKFKWIGLEPSEKEIEHAILSYLSFLKGVFAFKVNTQGTYDEKRKTYRRQSSWVVRGTADILACVSGRMVALEVKSKKGVQSDKQKEFERRMKEVGGHYFLVRSVDEAKAAIEAVQAALASVAS